MRNIATAALIFGIAVSLYAGAACFLWPALPPNSTSRLPSAILMIVGIATMCVGNILRSSKR